MSSRRDRSDIDPEGFDRPCSYCGPLYTYAGITEPGQFAPDCPVHGDPRTGFDLSANCAECGLTINDCGAARGCCKACEATGACTHQAGDRS